MTKSKKSGSQVIQGGINIKGNVTIKGGKIAGRDNVEKKIANANFSFAPVYHALKENTTIPPETKKTVEESVKQIEKEVKKGAEAKASFIQQRLENQHAASTPEERGSSDGIPMPGGTRRSQRRI